ncbi:hypothetical protein [Paraliomyxa miuraensis]|uniref:hypothetical protein n=1 Tax=Paraliomyxa miuraensis TaxID=376150 RepID=UPI0022555593|nr:hypothetical protein [Paraliomyxa miuraensis]MCX4240155.1 hypothetical protein [Paraliomyxa miuraensis]
MATPTFIKFSRLRGSVLDAVERIEDAVCVPWHCRLQESALLRPSYDAFDGGLELDGELEPCESMRAVAQVAKAGKPFALVYLSYDTRANFVVYFFDVAEDGFRATVSVESSYVWFRNDEYSPGRWFEGFLISLVSAFGADVCGYGRDDAYGLKHESIEVADILERLRTGDLLELPNPIFHAISVELIERSEIVSLMRSRPCSPRLEYKVAPGYHVLMDVAQPK